MKTFTEICIDVYFAKRMSKMISIAFVLGFCFMYLEDLSTHSRPVIMILAFLGFGQMWIENANGGKIPEKLKELNIIAEATCFGITMGGMFLSPDILDKAFYFIIAIMIIPAIKVGIKELQEPETQKEVN